MSGIGFWIIQIPGWVLFVYLVVAQCSAAFSYALGVRIGTQEPAENITEVGVAFFKGYAGADLVFYAPLLGVALGAHATGQAWAVVALAAALGVTAYWPIACLWSVSAARGKGAWTLPREGQYWVVLPVILIWALIGLVLLVFSAST
ncbi:hypothetical protein CLV78_12023 [Aliiruegeria haliotis]|uniref:Uncharacterized protein n=1 Tax=Aliiruegeria haliotis TaxID=1280846 RepID=A0A2T0REM6_9RHOB|nr:hypothetical protein [Aliiruegeria haliotis]PRY19607.1 hypothetical protein CLV78_12023 [Aliiruegeria haliotis]